MNIDDLIQKVFVASQQESSYPFLPEIHAALKVIKLKGAVPGEERAHFAAGLEKLVLEDFEFSESDLGGELLVFSECYVDGKEDAT